MNLEPLVTGPRIILAEHHAKCRDGYVERERIRRGNVNVAADNRMGQLTWDALP